MEHRCGLFDGRRWQIRMAFLLFALQTGVAGLGEPARRDLPSWHPRFAKRGTVTGAW